MQLDEARTRKAEILGEHRSEIRASSDEPGSGAGAIYVGIVPSDTPDGYRLAVRLTGDGPDEPTARIEAARATAGIDADVRYVGQVRALTTAPEEPVPDEPVDEPAPDESASGAV